MITRTAHIVLGVLTVLLVGCSPNEPTTPKVDDNPSRHLDSEYLYDIDAVPEILITVTETDWNTFLANFDNNPHNGLYVPAAFSGKLIYAGCLAGTRSAIEYGVEPLSHS